MYGEDKMRLKKSESIKWEMLPFKHSRRPNITSGETTKKGSLTEILTAKTPNKVNP